MLSAAWNLEYSRDLLRFMLDKARLGGRTWGQGKFGHGNTSKQQVGWFNTNADHVLLPRMNIYAILKTLDDLAEILISLCSLGSQVSPSL